MNPPKLSSMTLRHLHRQSCQRFNDDAATKVKAVISVPAYFTHFRRAETMLVGAMGASR